MSVNDGVCAQSARGGGNIGKITKRLFTARRYRQRVCAADCSSVACCSLIVRGGTRLAIRLRLACGPADREGGLELAAHCEVGEERGGRAGDEVRVGLGLGLGLGLGFRLGG